MANKEIIEYEATYILHGNKTIEEVAASLNKSPRTIQLHMNKELKETNPELYSQVKEHISKIARKRNVLGGQRGKRTPSEENIAKVENIIDKYYTDVEEDDALTLREISNREQISTSTLYDLLMKSEKINKEKLQRIFNNNRANASGSEALEPKYFEKYISDEEEIATDVPKFR